jgi:uncharacterized membrane protein
MGAWAGALVFDAVSWVSSTEWVYARGAWLMTALGVGVGLLAALLGLADLLSLHRGSRMFRIGVRHLMAMDCAVVLFAISFAIRNRSDFAWHESASPAAIAFSVAGLAALVLGTWLGTSLTYRHGVGVDVSHEPSVSAPMSSGPSEASELPP